MGTKTLWKHAGLAAALAMAIHGPASAQSREEFLKSRSGISFMEASGSGRISGQDPVDVSGALPGKAKPVLAYPRPRAGTSADVPAPSADRGSEPATDDSCKKKVSRSVVAGAEVGGVLGSAMMPFIGTIAFGTAGAAAGLVVGAVRCVAN